MFLGLHDDLRVFKYTCMEKRHAKIENRSPIKFYATCFYGMAIEGAAAADI
jgi:hypothetical protein